jgi:hypothetical protein
MPTKYLELDSTYRNRNLNENVGPGSFISQIAQTGMGTQITAVDPITYAYPDIVFTYAQTELTGAVGEVGLTYALPTTNSGFSSETKFLLTSQTVNAAAPGTNVDLPYAVNGFFVGAVLNIPIAAISTVQSPASPLNFRITEWIKLSDSQFLVSTELPVPLAAAVPNGGIRIFQPSTNITAGAGVRYVYIPSSLSISNYYTGSYIYNQTQNLASLITSYDKDTHLAQITTTIAWGGTDVLIVRKQLPKSYSDALPYTQFARIPSATGAINAIAPNRVVDLLINNVGAAIPLDASFINSFLRFFANTTDYTVNKIIGIVLELTPVGGGALTYVIDYDGSAYYQYNNAKTTAQYTSSAVLDTSIYALPGAPGSTCEIMSFNTDNYSPFSYNGSMSSQNQAVSYDVSLNSLVLPNVVLKTGGRIAYYPFVYVEIENLSTTTGGNRNAIYSNNPNAAKAVFKVPITDLNHPATTPFVKLTGNGMTQTLVFKSNTDMKMTVRLPDGSIFTPATSENPLGKAPNCLIQLSALFGLTRV